MAIETEIFLWMPFMQWLLQLSPCFIMFHVLTYQPSLFFYYITNGKVMWAVDFDHVGYI